MEKESMQKKAGIPTMKIFEAALKSGALDTNITIGDLVTKFDAQLRDAVSIDPNVRVDDTVAGYVCAWDKYVLVVGKDAPKFDIKFG